MKAYKTILALLLLLVVISAISLTSIKTVSAEKALTVTVSTDRPVYTTGEAVYITFYVTSGGKPVPGASLWCKEIRDGKLIWTFNVWATDSNGKTIEKWGGSSVADIPPGNYRIEATASKPGYTEAEGKASFEIVKRSSVDRPLSISVMSDKSVQGQEAIYRPGETATVSGLVSDGEGNPVKGATVSTQVTNPSGFLYSVPKTTDRNGYYEVVIKFLEDAATGQWNITVTASKDGYQKASHTVYVEVHAEKALDIFVISDKDTYRRGDRATISGYVYDGEGKTVEGATVSIRVLNPNDKPYTATKTTDKYGYYEVLNSFGETAITGEWMINVTASKDGYQEDSAYKIIYCEVMTLGIHSERMRLLHKYSELKKGHLLFSEGIVSTVTHAASIGLARDEFGHVGIYIGDFQVPEGETYEVRDKAQAPLKVYRKGKAKLLNLGDDIIGGDWLIGAVVEARWEGIVFTTVDGMKREAERYMKGYANFAWKTTQPPPKPQQVTKICEFALSKVNLTEKGGVQYDIGEKGSRDWTTKQEEWDCVNLGEAAYEYADLDPTPDAIEKRLIYLLPQVMFDYIDMPRHPPQEFPPKAIKAIDIIVKSPVKLHLYDSEGRHVGVNPQGVIERDIHSAFYYAEVGEYPQGIAILDVKDEYTLMIEALDEGSFDLIIQDLNVCTPGSITKIEFQEVPITKDTQTTLNLGSAGNEYLMRIDENGDGTVDQTLEPTSLATTPWTPETTKEKIGLTFESNSKPCGSSVQIPLTLNGIKDKIGNMDITLSYDPSVLEATEVTKGDLTIDSLFVYNIVDGTILISLADVEGFSGNGSIAYVTFDVTGAEGSTSPLQIAALAANRADDYEILTIPTNDGVFRVIFISTEESGGLTIRVSDTTGAKGSTVEVPINLEGASEVGSMDIVLDYDADVLCAVDVEAGALGKNALIESNTARDGEVIIALADSTGINGDGTVASVAFEVIGDVDTTSYLTLEEVLVHNLDFAEIIPNTESGTFEVT